MKPEKKKNVRAAVIIRDSFKQILSETKPNLIQFPWQNRQSYGLWLGQMYYFLCHASRLLALSASRFSMKDNKLHLRCARHLQEETGHETMAITDLKNLGFKITDFAELPETAQLYQSQYYLIEHVDPAAIFGSVLYLEGLSVHGGPEVCKKAVDAHGDKATHFLRSHTNDDQTHIQEALAAIENCSVEQAKVIQWSMRQSQHAFELLLNRGGQAQKLRKAA